MTVDLEKQPPMSPEHRRSEADRLRLDTEMARDALVLTVSGVDRPDLTTYFVRPRRQSAEGLLLSATHPDKRAIPPRQQGLDMRKAFQRNIENSSEMMDFMNSVGELSDGEIGNRSENTLSFLRSEPLRLTAPVPAGSEGKEAFDQTQRDRKMFEAGESGASVHESYASELFAGTLTPEIVAHIAENLDGKVVFNLGGGNSRLSEELAEHGAHTDVINVEPYASDRAKEGQDEGYDHLLEENPADKDFIEKSELPLHSADEIWAMYSVPAYLGSKEEVANLFENVTKLIKPGGVIRISHLGIVGATEGDPRVATLISQLEKAKDAGFLLEKTKTTRGITLLMTAPEK